MLTFSVQGQPTLEKVISALNDKLDLTLILDEAAALMYARNRARFLQQVDPDNVAWLPSKASLIRARRGRGGGTLYNTGKLFNSIQLYRVGEDSRAIGTDVPYGRFNQIGTIKIQARQFLGFGVEDIKLAHSLVLKRLTEALI